MRLIDLDRFKEKEGIKWEINGKETFYYSADYIESRYEVEAIPVEWIVEQIGKERVQEEWELQEYGECSYWSTAWKVLIKRWKGKDNGN